MALRERYDTETELLTADFFRATLGRFVVDVSWRPEKDPTGAFHCKVVLDGKWETPLEELVTKNGDEMMYWTQKQMKEAAKRTQKP